MSLPLDQTKIPVGTQCPMCGQGTLARDGTMDGGHYPDQCSRPWYTCDQCGEGMDGDMCAEMEADNVGLDDEDEEELDEEDLLDDDDDYEPQEGDEND